MKKVKCRSCLNRFFVYSESDWQTSKMPCPLCGETYCVLPQTERLLAVLQDKFLENREEKYMEQIFRILYNSGYVKNILKKSSMSFPENDDDYYAYVASTKVVERYYKSPDFRLRSFGGYVKTKLLEALYQKSELPQEVMVAKAGYSAVSLDYETAFERVECQHIEAVEENVMDNHVLSRMKGWADSCMGWRGLGQLLWLFARLENKDIGRFWNVSGLEIT